MTKKIYYTWQNINQQVAELAHQIVVGGWKPDYIVGITRGGVTPAVMLSHFLSCKMYTLDVRLRDTGDGDGCESNLWMAEDAFGYVQEEDRGKFSCRDDRYHHTSMIGSRAIGSLVACQMILGGTPCGMIMCASRY